MTKVRIMLIEDNRILREGVREVIDKQSDMTVSALSDGRDDTIGKARKVDPQVVLMDLGLDGQNSLNTAAALKKEFKGIKIIGMGLAPSQSEILEFVQAGAEGFVLKNASLDDMLRTIREVAAGETVLPPPMTGTLFTQVAELALARGRKNLKGSTRMTQREKEVIALIGDGSSNKQIAKQLNIAVFTVKSHVHNVLEKLALHSRLQIARYAHNVESDPLLFADPQATKAER